MQILPNPGDSVSSLSFSPKSNLLVATSWDNQVPLLVLLLAAGFVSVMYNVSYLDWLAFACCAGEVLGDCWREQSAQGVHVA